MQNQAALVIIFLIGLVLIIGSLLDSEYLLGRKESYKALKGKIKHPLLTRIFLRITRTSVIEDDGTETVYIWRQRQNKRTTFIFLGLVFIVLGIIALNSGKFS